MVWQPGRGMLFSAIGSWLAAAVDVELAMERKLAAILAADVVGYSALMERDEAGTFERLKARRKEIFEPEVEKHHGRIFKLTGDGVFAEFASVVNAVECAVLVQRGMAERNASALNGERIDVRIGINLGEVIVEGEDRYGEGVNVAARLQQLADPGGICVSGKVAKEVEKKLAFGFEPMGEQHMKNIAEPVQAFRVKIDGTPPRRMMPRTAKRLWPWAAVAMAAIAAGIWFATTRPTKAPEPSDIPSIAVLPFDDMGPDPNLAYLGDGVADDIISMLARSPDLAVVARNSSFVYKGKATDIRQIGKELGVGYVLEGSVRKDRDKIRITAQLIDARSGDGVWAEQFDKSGGDPWALQDDVTGRIIGALSGDKGQLIRSQYQQAWGKDSAGLQEYDYYLRGNDLFANARTHEDKERGGAIWREGLAQFPDSPLLKVKLGLYYFDRVIDFTSEDYDADNERAASLARQALTAPDISPLVRKLAHWLLARVLSAQHQPEAAIAEAESARELAPYDANMLGNLAATLIENGHPEKGLEWIELAASREPGAERTYNYRRGWAYTVMGKSEEAIASLKQGPDSWVDVPILMAINYVRLGRLSEAKTEVARALQNEEKVTQLSWRKGYFYSDPAIIDGQIADLIKAGLPEK